jgi:hypothetical protein
MKKNQKRKRGDEHEEIKMQKKKLLSFHENKDEKLYLNHYVIHIFSIT